MVLEMYFFFTYVHEINKSQNLCISHTPILSMDKRYCMLHNLECSPTDEWGPRLWLVQHLFTILYPDSPSNVIKLFAYNFFKNFVFLIPCEKCQQHYFTLINNELPDEEGLMHYFDSQRNLMIFGMELHNKVSSRLNKLFEEQERTQLGEKKYHEHEIFTIDRFMEKYNRFIEKFAETAYLRRRETAPGVTPDDRDFHVVMSMMQELVQYFTDQPHGQGVITKGEREFIAMFFVVLRDNFPFRTWSNTWDQAVLQFKYEPKHVKSLHPAEYLRMVYTKMRRDTDKPVFM